MTMARTIRKYPAAFALSFLCMGFWYPILAQDNLEVTVAADGKLGNTAHVNCTVEPPNANIVWRFKEEIVNNSNRINITTVVGVPSEAEAEEGVRPSNTSTLLIANSTSDDAGNYTCVASLGNVTKSEDVTLKLRFDSKLVNQSKSRIVEDAVDHANVTMQCIFEVYERSPVRWWRQDAEGNLTSINENVTQAGTDQQLISTYSIWSLKNIHNGTYYCEVEDFTANGTFHIFVMAPPHVTIDKIIAVNTTQLYFNWTVTKFNTEVKSYTLLYRQMDSKEGFVMYARQPKVNPNNTSFVLSGLENSTNYMLRLDVNDIKMREYGPGRTLDQEPLFVPNITINGFSATSVTIGWAPPPNVTAQLIHYYDLEARKKGENISSKAYHPRDERNLPYMFAHLEPHSTYVFRVRACSDFTGKCWNWSKEMEAATLDGIPSKPSYVTATCGNSYLRLTWGPPSKLNAEIKGYSMEVTGNATYRDRYGTTKIATWGPLAKFMTNETFNITVNDLQPNTNYTIRVSAMTRTRRRGEENTTQCTTSPSAPDSPPRPKWRKIYVNDTYMFKMYLPRISERNGLICCYRVYMVRLPPHTVLASLPLQSHIQVFDGKDAHDPTDSTKIGAYITDVFSNDDFPSGSELVLGDGSPRLNKSDRVLKRSECRRCLQMPRREPRPAPPPTPSTSTEPDLLDEEETATQDPFEESLVPPRNVRSYVDNDYSKYRTMLDGPPAAPENQNELVLVDGPLDPNSNYTMFVELITAVESEEPMYSDYTSVLMPAPTPPVIVPSTALEIALQITCAVAAVILLLMIIFCIMQTRRSRKMPPHAHLEMNSIPAIIRHVVGGFCGRQQLITTVPPSQPPIAKEDLADAYAKRQADSDYEFQKEFEMLPEYYPDRTTHASEARENQPKNRYPDIKAYDQTRVKLSQIDGITGSDYINANYVMGYQERKQFICAQGPTDTTVNDFWRMIWEHGLELIVMLTNLEEYSKVKCSKYWPEERAARAFGNITVQHVGEKRYSDYIVRELKITKQSPNSDGQHIIENNGVAKRNGDIKDPESSVPTSPRESKESSDARLVRQYHFLMWKDFAAPEQPHSILKFIKRVNEAWSNVIGRPIVVHCSAGVGRTGTLVALDCLLEQLEATGQVAVFNTVAELRRQRNFLVQSLKQYVFVYRALVEHAHYGDTELVASRLKQAVDRLRHTPDAADKCLMELEFEKILNPPIPEPVKSCAAGAAEELRSRNRSESCLPYDRNRVILAPLPGRDFSTYINACFIEAYDNTEGFIITQDPLPNTIMDFWRMVTEHNVTTIVMLSEIGEGKCPRYWDDGTAQYEHISVQYEESESCPYYTRRQFTVTNEKSGSASSVRQLQYQGWPTAPGHVPEVTRGLAELADAAAPAATMLVHCQFGTERAPLFVALCTLIRQLRVERRVDVGAVARSLRHQRADTVDTFLQYEFLYRAILNYAELHNLLEDS